MKTIYSHLGATSFDPENLRNSAKDVLRVDAKPSYGLWGSPFNKKCWDWESYNMRTMNPNANEHMDKLAAKGQKRWEEFLSRRGYTINDYYELSNDQKQSLNCSYDKMAPLYSPKDEIEAKASDEIGRIRFAANARLNAFYFCLDDSKILHISTIDDALPYARAQSWFGFKAFSLSYLDYDKIKEDGYDGVEICSMRNLRDTHLGYMWDVDSVVVWNPECITPVPKEVAYLARAAAGIQDSQDMADPMMDAVVITRWFLEQGDLDMINKAVDDGFLSKDMAVEFIERAIKTDELRRTVGCPSFGYSRNEVEVTYKDTKQHGVEIKESDEEIERV